MIVGRDAERAALAGVIEAVRRGDGGALLLEGEPGAGKSVLLADAVASAGDLRVVRVRGVESEFPLAFAALHRLVRPLLGSLEELPARQAAALRAALGLAEDGDGATADRFLVYLAGLTLLSDAAASVPTLVVVDDVHWLDVASREALLFVARRTEGERLGVLLGARDDHALKAADIPTMRVGGLGVAEARSLLSRTAGIDVPETVAERLHAGTAGNPLALVELAGALPADALAGTAPLPRTLPTTGGVEAAFLDRYHRLDPEARTVLLVAAADDSGDLAVVERAALRLGADDAALGVAERSGLLSRSGTRVELRHPLVRSAVYAGVPTTDRRRAHAALAASLPPEEADRRAWHLAAATDQPDDAVVAQLEAAARRSAAAGGHEAASAAWERAAELTREPTDRARRMQGAAAEAWTAGQPDRAADLADAALLSPVDPLLRADAALLRARVEWNTGSVGLAHRRLLDEAALVAPHDPARAREMAMFAASLGAMLPVEPYGDPLALLGEPGTARERCVAEVLTAFVRIAEHRWDAAVRAVRAAELHAEEADLGVADGLLANLALAAMHLAVDDVALRLHERLLARAREESALIMVLYALTRRGGLDVALGRWDELAAGAREALGLAKATGRPALAAMPRAWLAIVSALRGEADAADRLADLERVVASGPLGTTEASVRDQVLWTRAALADTPETSVHHYEQMTHGFAERLISLDRIEAAVRADRRDLAERWQDHIAAFAEATGSPWATAVAEHGMALLVGPEHAEPHFLNALQAHERSSRRVDAARTQLAYGSWLRRARRRVDARPHLRAALQTFEDVGARQWAERAAQELRASGERARRRHEERDAPRLTPTELGVATLVAQGLPTRDVAAQLFVSPRTVDFHLRNVFAKLGVTSRAELAHVSLG